jgi:2-oxoglutarate ferredoxin oxidoreductase subunit gamma
MNEQILCAGFGGQGIMLMGKLLAYIGMKQGYNVTWLPSYGAEVRGGTAHSMVHISTGPVASPTVSKPTTCIVMNKPSLAKFAGRVKEKGLLIVNASMVERIPKRRGIRIASLPLTKLAVDLGEIKAANMVALGAFVGLRKLFPLKNVTENLSAMLPLKKELIDINKKALELGYSFVTKGKQ